MSELVDPSKIESIVGASRHPHRHLGRAVSSEQEVYVLHSILCKHYEDDLRDCRYSRLLDRGIDAGTWDGWEDRAVVLGIGRQGLIPLRLVDTKEKVSGDAE